METKEVKIEGVEIIYHTKHTDNRGSFCELQKSVEVAEGQRLDQVNLINTMPGILRGAHVSKAYQWKHVHVLEGTIIHVLIDLREGSPTFGVEQIIQNSADMPMSMSVLVPPHVGNAVVSITPAKVLYTTNIPYTPELELSVKLSQHWYKNYMTSAKDAEGITPEQAKDLIYEHCNR